MKIGILIDRLNVGGVEKIAIEEVRALRSAGQDASLVVMRQKAVTDILDVFGSIKDIPVIYLDERLPTALRASIRFPLFSFFSWFHISYSFLLPFVVKKHEFDYLIAHGTYTSLTAVALKKRRGIHFSAFIWDPAVYIVDRVYAASLPKFVTKILHRCAYSFDKYLIRNMDSVLVGGPAHNTLIHSIDSSKVIDIIYPSVHPIKKLREKKQYALVITAWKRGKNPEYLFKLAKEIPDLHIKLAGKWIDPQYELEFKDNVKNENLGERLEVLGSVNEERLTALYAEATVILQTNNDKGFGMPALEAAGNGTTFIIPEGQGVCELFVNGKHGYYTKEKDTKTIIKYLKILFGDNAKATEMGREAWLLVNKEYSWAKHAEQLLGAVASVQENNEIHDKGAEDDE